MKRFLQVVSRSKLARVKLTESETISLCSSTFFETQSTSSWKAIIKKTFCYPRPKVSGQHLPKTSISWIGPSKSLEMSFSFFRSKKVVVFRVIFCDCQNDSSSRNSHFFLSKSTGFARLASESRHNAQQIDWILPPGLSAKALGGVFDLHWICRKELPFSKTLHLFNPLNEGKPVKIARDGQVCICSIHSQ